MTYDSVVASAGSTLDSLVSKLMERVDQRINAAMLRNNQHRSNVNINSALDWNRLCCTLLELPTFE